MSTEQRVLSLGEHRVRIKFNTNEDKTVKEIKEKSAELIDLIMKLKDMNEFEEVEAITEYIRNRERAATLIEDGCSIAVKAYFSPTKLG